MVYRVSFGTVLRAGLCLDCSLADSPDVDPVSDPAPCPGRRGVRDGAGPAAGVLPLSRSPPELGPVSTGFTAFTLSLHAGSMACGPGLVPRASLKCFKPASVTSSSAVCAYHQ